jgi:tRNA dimethylallyltransferase
MDLDPLVIVGPTASGKSALALALARAEPGVELVSADAFAVYRGMDIGTAKPTPAEQAAVPHHLIDVVDPEAEYTVAQFQQAVQDVLARLAARGATPVVVGGTGLYVRAVVDRFTLPPQFPEVRAELEREASNDRLWQRLAALDPVVAAKMLPSNRRRVVRALEVTVGAGRPFSSYGPGVDAYPVSPFRQVGLALDRAELDRRIEARYQDQLEAGFVAEVAALARRPLSRTAAQALGYAELAAHLDGRLSLSEALDTAVRRTRRFARRQERWFRRDPRITWFDARHPDVVRLVHDWWRKPSGAADA